MIMTSIYHEPEEKKGKEVMGSTFAWHMNYPYFSYCVQFWQFEGKKFTIEAYYMIGKYSAWIW